MTTSVLSYQYGELNDYDLQVLRDFALEAPWNWRQMFNALLHIVDQDKDYEAELAALKGIRDDAVDAIADIKVGLATLRKAYNEGAITEADLATCEATINDNLENLTEALVKEEK